MPKYNKRNHNVDSLNEITGELKRLVQSLNLAITAIEQDGVETLNVRNNTWLDKGLTGIRKFTEALREAHYNWRVESACFGKPRKRKR